MHVMHTCCLGAAEDATILQALVLLAWLQVHAGMWSNLWVTGQANVTIPLLGHSISCPNTHHLACGMVGWIAWSTDFSLLLLLTFYQLVVCFLAKCASVSALLSSCLSCPALVAEQLHRPSRIIALLLSIWLCNASTSGVAVFPQRSAHVESSTTAHFQLRAWATSNAACAVSKASWVSCTQSTTLSCFVRT